MERFEHTPGFDETGVDRSLIGIIGLGRAGFAHFSLSHFSDELETVAVCRRDRHLMVSQCAPHDQIAQYVDYQALFAEVPLDGAIIATPPDAMARVAACALRAGTRFLLLEKPGAEAASGLGQLVEPAKNLGAGIYIAYPRRARTDIRQAREWINKRPADYSIDVVWSDAYERWFDGPPTPEVGFRAKPSQLARGALLESGCHAIDLLLYLFGPVKAVTAVRLSRGKTGKDIAGELELAFEHGHTASIQLENADACERRRDLVAVSGELKLEIGDATTRWSDECGETIVAANRPELLQQAMFSSAIRGQMSDDLCDLRQGLAVLDVIDRAYAADDAR